MNYFLALLLCVLATVCQADVHHLKQHKQHKQHEQEDRHYLPPEYAASDDEQPYYKKEKHTSEHVVYHKHDEHEHKPQQKHYEQEHYEHAPKKQRVDHYHHYDKKPEHHTSKPVHYKVHQPQLRRDSNVDLFTPAATQTYYQRRRPNRLVYASAPGSVFHTQINVQSQDAQLNSDATPIGQLPGGQAPTAGFLPNNPGGDQLNTGAFGPNGQLPNGGQLPAGVACDQFPAAGNAPGCGFPNTNPIGGQFPASALAPGANLPTNANVPQTGTLAVQGNGQRPPRPQYGGKPYGHYRTFNDNFGPLFAAPVNQAPGGAQLSAAQFPAGQAPLAQFPNQNAPLGGQLAAAQFPAGQAPLAQFPDGGQLPTAQFPAGAQLPTAQFPAGAQLPTAQFPAGGQLPVGAPFVPNFGGQAPVAQLPLRRSARPRDRSNYQGLNVVNGNVLGQPHLQGPSSAFGNQQDTNIIDGNFYSDAGYAQHHHGKRRNLLAVNGNRRAVLLSDDDDVDEDDASLDFAGNTPQLIYVAPQAQKLNKSSGKHHSTGLQAAASTRNYSYDDAGEQETNYHEDGYHYQKPKHTFET